MTQYYIIEIQQDAAGGYAHLVHYAWDDNPDKARLKAESIYHSILASAATSETKKHSAVILSDECFPVMHSCYKHNVTAPVVAPAASEDENEETGTGAEDAEVATGENNANPEGGESA